ncbi:uncharacterized protein VTP21DRAFT_8628 [Calcarisporiella thermophila]|uniref:uncharacterized protein n=1 Tax=Calcarisporiella thermophila TaxID=911321 RepID=UPI003742F015
MKYSTLSITLLLTFHAAVAAPVLLSISTEPPSVTTPTGAISIPLCSGDIPIDANIIAANSNIPFKGNAVYDGNCIRFESINVNGPGSLVTPPSSAPSSAGQLEAQAVNKEKDHLVTQPTEKTNDQNSSTDSEKPSAPKTPSSPSSATESSSKNEQKPADEVSVEKEKPNQSLPDKAKEIKDLLPDISVSLSRKGDGTFFTPGLGACGHTNTEGDMIAAVSSDVYGKGGNNASVCGKKVQVQGPKGKITVTIADECPPCKAGDLDLSPSAFKLIADPIDGRVPISWNFI